MAASEMGFSRSGPPGTRRSRPAHSGEPPKHAGWPRRAQRAVRLACSAGCHPPWWPPTYERPEHGHHARAERVGRVWVGLIVARIASPNVGARTCSICARVTLRRVAPCAAPEALGGPWSPGTRPLCTPGGGGRSTGCTATARAYEDPAPSAELPREAFTAPLRAPRGAPGGVCDPRRSPTSPCTRLRARRARRIGAGQPHGL